MLTAENLPCHLGLLSRGSRLSPLLEQCPVSWDTLRQSLMAHWCVVYNTCPVTLLFLLRLMVVLALGAGAWWLESGKGCSARPDWPLLCGMDSPVSCKTRACFGGLAAHSGGAWGGVSQVSLCLSAPPLCPAEVQPGSLSFRNLRAGGTLARGLDADGRQQLWLSDRW